MSVRIRQLSGKAASQPICIYQHLVTKGKEDIKRQGVFFFLFFRPWIIDYFNIL